ncbi:hypothetical protein B0T18DRAFT_35688 [Schizothecium vesticola]|uniref:C2H2-type domain-containing protein n=1 Tax=Schizothecium vesticola TaxID=314040 RepID=A0AA40FAR9_9PEZI|nr:hypothetical protein B0T18DRAFT_35688 [Schizothecium vesticola]
MTRTNRLGHADVRFQEKTSRSGMRVPPPPGTPEPLSRLGHLAQQLDELREIVNGARRTAQYIRRQIERGIVPSQSLASGTSVGDSSHTLLSAQAAQTATASSTATTSRIMNPIGELAGDHRPKPSLEGVQMPTEGESSTRSPSSRADYPHIDKKSSISLSRHASPFPGSAMTSPFRASSILAAQIGASVVYSPGYGRDARPDVPRTLVEEPTSRLHEHPSLVSADSSDDEDDADSFFTNFDDRVRRALRAEPSISSAAENTIRRLHTLPGELRALVYDFPTRLHFEGFPEAADAGEGGSLASRSVTSSNSTSRKLFRCPFNVANPREHWRGGCKGPGFPLSRLGDHLERCHLSYECPRCGTDCVDDDGLEQHACNIEQFQRVGAATPTIPSDRITDLKLRRIRGMLKPSKKGKIWDEERWFQMWEALFPGVGERPEPCMFLPPPLSGT